MNKKLGILAIAALFTLSGAILKGTQMANANLVQPTTVTHQNFTDMAILNHSCRYVGAVPPCPPSEGLGNHGGIAPTRIMQMI